MNTLGIKKDEESAESAEDLKLLRRFRQQIKHSNDSSLIYLFSSWRKAQWLASKLNPVILTPAEISTDSVSNLIHPILKPCDPQSSQVHYWLKVDDASPEWDMFRRFLLARLNERRSMLTRNKGVVCLLFPLGFEAQAADAAPDLWSIRSASYSLQPEAEGRPIAASCSPQSPCH